MKILTLMMLFCSISFANSYASLLFHGNCITCHDITTSKSAPSIKKVKQRYIEAFSQKSDFVDYMSVWVLNPNESGSLMHDEINKYGLMPHLAFDQQTLKEISTYIYETKF